MFTDTELKDALEYSAERADLLPDTTLAVRPAPRHRRAIRVGLPVLAAAAVVGVVATAAVVADGSSSADRHQHSAAAKSSHPVTVKPAPAKAPDAHVPVRVSVNDLVSVRNEQGEYDIRSTTDPAYNVEYVTRPISNQQDGPDLVVLPKSAHFDPATRFTNVERVDVDGVSAYYGSVVLHPANGKADMDTDKHGGPQRALGIEKAGGTWLFVTSDNFAPLDLKGLIAAYQNMHVVVRSGTVKIPFRTGYVPAGMSLDSLAMAGTNPVSDVRFTRGKRSIDINIAAGGLDKYDPSAKGLPAANGKPMAHPIEKQIGGYTVMLMASGYDRATLTKMLNTMKFGNLADGGATWWTITQAFG